jgi:hypothetical protein
MSTQAEIDQKFLQLAIEQAKKSMIQCVVLVGLCAVSRLSD